MTKTPATSPAVNPFTRALPPGLSPFEAAAHMVARRAGWSGPLGMSMKEGDPDPDDPDDPDDDEEDTDPDTELRLNGKVVKVGDLQRMFAREKRQGKRSGTSTTLRELGFDSIEDAKAALADLDNDDDTPKGKRKPKDKDDDDDAEATAAARRREAAADRREREAAAKVRRADLRSALRDGGVARADLDDALAILDRAVGDDYDDDDLEDAVDELKDRRPALFGEVDDDQDDDKRDRGRGGRKPSKQSLPQGRPKQKNRTSTEFGAGGMDRARRRGWVKDNA